jgi:hypothetical protein
MKYLTKFDDTGKRLSSYAIDSTMTDERYDELTTEGYVEISEEDWNYYVGNKGTGANGTGYIRGTDGNPTDAPAYVPSKDELLTQLDTDYNRQKAVLSEQYTSAMMTEDTDLADEVKAELTALNEWYDEEYEKIAGGE